MSSSGNEGNDREIIALHISRRDLSELIDTLRKAEELCQSIRHNEHDFRMQRVRMEMLRQSSVPPPPPTSDAVPERRESTRYVLMTDLTADKKKS